MELRDRYAPIGMMQAAMAMRLSETWEPEALAIPQHGAVQLNL